MTRDFFWLLILLNIILYSKFERRHKRHQESRMHAYSEPSQISSSYSSIKTAKGHLQWDELRRAARGRSRLSRAVLRPDVQSSDPEARMSLW